MNATTIVISTSITLLLIPTITLANTDPTIEDDELKWQQLLNYAQMSNTVIDDNKNQSMDKVTEQEKLAKDFIEKPSTEPTFSQRTVLAIKNLNPLQQFIKANNKKLTATIYTLDHNHQRILADTKVEPFKNIESAIEDIYSDSLNDFDSALPRLQKAVKDASEAVGYYDLNVRFSQTDNDKNNVNVIIEYLDNPAIVQNRVVDIRGEAKNLPVFSTMEKDLKPLKGEVFNQGQYQASKAIIDSKSKQLGFFDGKWLNTSADVILPDNKVDIDLIYDSGQGYQFDKVVFFTIDDKTGKITTDPDKLPVNIDLLKVLLNFKAGDGYDSAKINQLRNSLNATKYFTQINVDTVLPDSQADNKQQNSDNNNPIQQQKKAIDKKVINKKPVDIGLITFIDPNIDDIEQLTIKQLNTKSQTNNTFNGTASDILTNLIDSTEQDNDDTTENDDKYEQQLASIVFSVNDSTKKKYLTIKQKAEALLKIPEDRLAKRDDNKSQTPLGKLSDGISNIAKTILPEQEINNDSIPSFPNKQTPEMVKQRKKVPLYVFVATSKPYDAQIGIGYGTDQGLRLTGNMENTLINKDGLQAGIKAQWASKEKKISFNAYRPWKHPVNDRLNAGVSYQQKTINQTNNQHWKNDSLIAQIGRTKHSKTGWNRQYALQYRYDRLKIGENSTNTNQESLPIQFVGSSTDQQALSIRASMSKTTADNLTNPTQGYKQHYSVETGVSSPSLKSQFTIAKAGISGIHSFGKDNKHQAVGKLNAGYMWADDFKTVPYGLRFFAGGDQSIRGYDYNSLSPIANGYLTGGQALATASAEYNYQFADKFRGAVFADVGNAYDKDFTTPTKIGLGFGIRWASPIGPVRIDIGGGIKENDIPVRLHLFIGSPL